MFEKINTLILALGAYFKRLKARVKEAKDNSPVEKHKPPTGDSGNPDFDHIEEPKKYPVIFYFLTIVWVVVMMWFAWIASEQWSDKFIVTLFDTRFSVMKGQVIAMVQILWLLASIKVLGVDQVGAVVLWGLPMVNVGRGPKLIIFGFFQIEKFGAFVHQDQHPDEPDFVQKTPDEVPLETVEIIQEDGTIMRKQKVRPIRINTATRKDKFSKDEVLNSQMVVEASFWVRWIIDNPLNLIISAEGDVKKVIKQMRDTGESLLINEVSSRVPLELISEFDKIRSNLEKKIRESVTSWGVHVIDVGLINFDLGHSLASEMKNTPIVKAQTEQLVIKAIGEKTRLINEGKGRGKAIEEELVGEGRGLKRGAHFIGTEPKEYLEAKVAEKTVGEGDLIVGTEGVAQVIGLGKAILRKEKANAAETPEGDS